MQRFPHLPCNSPLFLYSLFLTFHRFFLSAPLPPAYTNTRIFLERSVSLSLATVPSSFIRATVDSSRPRSSDGEEGNSPVLSSTGMFASLPLSNHTSALSLSSSLHVSRSVSRSLLLVAFCRALRHFCTVYDSLSLSVRLPLSPCRPFIPVCSVFVPQTDTDASLSADIPTRTSGRLVAPGNREV